MAQAQRQVDKPLPANVPAEKALLGAILLDNALFVAASALEPGDFSLTSHGLIFENVQAMLSRGDAVDPITLVEELTSTGQLALVGELPTAYINDLSGDTLRYKPSVKDWAKIIKAKSLQRRLIQACTDASKRAFEGESGMLIIEGLRESLASIEASARQGMRGK